MKIVNSESEFGELEAQIHDLRFTIHYSPFTLLRKLARRLCEYPQSYLVFALRNLSETTVCLLPLAGKW